MKFLTEAKRLEIRNLLEAEAQTYETLHTATGLSHEILGRHIRELRALKVVHVSGYIESESRGRRVMEFSWGTQPDVAPPAALSNVQRALRSRAARKEKLS